MTIKDGEHAEDDVEDCYAQEVPEWAEVGDALGLGWVVDLNGNFLDVNAFPALEHQQFQFGFITAREQSH